ncbi:sarcosine oxidase subunit gamma [Rhodoligotrophos appendicifer]|uniref:sarcosine oxidase subunit gamma n=1 Tax=Rhodoligotrophos appendicifer TaxID=987056 RepID=UPI001186C793|nr:sarcosine oxidase subunit gamma family protein [Rhodoligotrophos appendicifer]
MSEPIFASPLSHRREPTPPPGLSIAIEEITGQGAIDLRGDPADPAFLDAVRDVFGLTLPTAPRTSAAHGAVTALWLSTDQWLILVPRDEAPAMTVALSARLGDLHSLVCDVSDMRCIFRLEGDGVREVLMKGCSLDLFGAAIEPGYVKRVLFAEIAALIRVVSRQPEVFELYVFRSYADYAYDWLLKTAALGARLTLYGEQPPPAV